jgi:hypothetical protein
MENFKADAALTRISRILLKNRYRSGFHRTRQLQCFSYQSTEKKLAVDVDIAMCYRGADDDFKAAENYIKAWLEKYAI